jgi:probable phosphoglycerate mutase
MHVYFVRHGESTANVESILSTQDPQLHPLTETGRGQALEVGAKLADVPIAAAYSSDLLRAVETAEIILDSRAVPLETTPLLREHNVGELEGRRDEAAWQTLVSYFDAWMQGDLAAGPPGGENYIELNQRFQRFARQLVERHGDMRTEVLVVAHAGYFWGGFPSLFENVDLAFMRARGVNNGDVIVGQYSQGRWVCLEWAGETLSPGA